ncbi:ligase [Bordetella ansorpii]|uniref:Ligase n=1 Tax=Bordetella ansorpii TaxID=288768 RepID=A0A157RHU4_9BORD|nr:AMP-binding protein [Bordetella ansorpii]SAI57553.1 ligase [Bordetella ansorpii]
MTGGIHGFLDRSAQAWPQRDAVVFEERGITYETLRADSCRIAHQLLALDLEPGARIATYMVNHPAAFACQFGIDRTPHAWLPLNYKSSLDEAVDIMNDFSAQWLFVHSSLDVDVRALRTRVPTLRGVICVDRALEGAPFLDEWIAQASSDDPGVPVGAFGTAVLRTTGGSTGKPKGVMRTHLCQVLQVADYLAALPYDEPPRNLVLTPLSHAAGSSATPVFELGGTHYILNSTAAGDILASIERHRITTVFMPPTMIYNLLVHPGARGVDLSSLKYLIYGSAPMSQQKLREAWELFGPVLTQVYGMTEASSTISIMTPREHAHALAHRPQRLSSCGRGSANYRIRIVRPDGGTAQAGELGEVACASYEVMSGYFANPGATEQAVQHGWLRTGDIGYQDEEGYLYIVDRLKDVIISGGFNVYPGEVEQVVFQHPAVKDCAVVGAPDDKWGEAVTAVIELKPGSALDPDELMVHCRTRLSGVKSPKRVLVWDTLPKSPAGKVLRKDVRAHFWQDLERKI